MIKKIIVTVLMGSALLNAMDYGAMVGAIKTPEAIQAASKGTDVTMDDVTNSVDTTKLAGAVMGDSSSATAQNISTASKAADTANKVKQAKDSKDTIQQVQTGMEVGKALKLF